MGARGVTGDTSRLAVAGQPEEAFKAIECDEGHLVMKPKKLPPLSPTEWRLMSCVWDLRAANPPQVSDHLRSKMGEELSSKTVGIFLARLEEKGYLRSAPETALAGRGRPPHVYQALVTREESLRWQLEKFLEDHLIGEEDLGLLETLLSRSSSLLKASG